MKANFHLLDLFLLISISGFFIIPDLIHNDSLYWLKYISGVIFFSAIIYYVRMLSYQMHKSEENFKQLESTWLNLQKSVNSTHEKLSHDLSHLKFQSESIKSNINDLLSNEINAIEAKISHTQDILDHEIKDLQLIISDKIDGVTTRLEVGRTNQTKNIFKTIRSLNKESVANQNDTFASIFESLENLQLHLNQKIQKLDLELRNYKNLLESIIIKSPFQEDSKKKSSLAHKYTHRVSEFKPIDLIDEKIIDYDSIHSGVTLVKHESDFFRNFESRKLKKGLSIIVLNKNGSEHLKDLFSSFIKHVPLIPYEIIVIDHNSSDSSLEAIETFIKLGLNIKPLSVSENYTFSFSNNEALSVVSFDKLMFLNNDIIFQNEMLEESISLLDNKPNIGTLGYLLKFPDDKIQHSGIDFSYDSMLSTSANYFKSQYKVDGKQSHLELIKLFDQSSKLQKSSWLDLKFYRPKNKISKPEKNSLDQPAVTAAALMCRTREFVTLNGFDEDFIYGYEDVELCLRFKRVLDKESSIFGAGKRSYFIHNESASQKKDSKVSVRSRRLHNIMRLREKCGRYLCKQYTESLIDNAHPITQDVLTFGIAVTSDDPGTAAGDFFTAQELGKELEKFGWKVIYLSSEKDWYNLSEIDVLLTLIDKYDLTKIYNTKPNLIKIAWPRNWFDRWMERVWFGSYDIILSSSVRASNMYYEKFGFSKHVFPLATNPNRFNEKQVEKVNGEFTSDYCFTGSYWNHDRDIIKFLDPDSLDYDFGLFGYGWEKVEKLKKYFRGFVNYKSIPGVYKSTSLVIDDANHVTKTWGSVNSRVFDALASGCLVISNSQEGSDALFNGKLPVYTDKRDLHTRIRFFLQNEKKRKKLVDSLRSVVLENHTYKKRAEELRIILKKHYDTREVFSIKVPVPDLAQIDQWGDYHFAKSIAKSLRLKGKTADISIMPKWYSNHIAHDFNLVIRGLSKFKLPKHSKNIIWNISHPDKIEIDEYNAYDLVCIASITYLNKIKDNLTTQAIPLLQATDPDLFEYKKIEKGEIIRKLLFVGNSRNQFRRSVKYAIKSSYEIDVFGSHWDKFIDKKLIKGLNIKNNQLFSYYRRYSVVLNDHWDTMLKNGFVSNRLFDAAHCGSIIVSDHMKEIKEIFGNYVFTYKNKNEFRKTITEAIQNDNVYLREGIHKLVNERHTFDIRIQELLSALEECQSDRIH